MNTLLRGILVLSAMAVTSPPAWAQAVTTFDGIYHGVSNTTSGGRECTAAPAPSPLTVKNGAAHFVAGLGGATTFQGTVGADGTLTMRNERGMVLSGKIEPSGKASGGYGGSRCLITSVWQKR